MTSYRRRNAGFTLIELLVVIAIIGVLIALLLPAVQSARESGRRALCQANMHNLALAVVNYMDNNGVAPAIKNPYTQPTAKGIVVGPRQLEGASSFIAILPFVEQQAGFDSYNASLGSYAFANSTGMRLCKPSVYICPSDLSKPYAEVRFNGSPAGPNNQLSYSMNAGTWPCLIWGYGGDSNWGYWVSVPANGFWKPVGGSIGTFSIADGQLKTRDATDGLSKTVVYGEASRYVGQKDLYVRSWQQAIYFGVADTWVADYPTFSFAVPDINAKPSANGQQTPPCIGAACEDWLNGNGGYPGNGGSALGEWGFRSFHPGGANFVMADGTVHYISESVSKNIRAAISTPAGGETDNNF
jgi:prepilin-type N-terminal cleavage/methylation domain-containing protein/prepilin-type processing-associated H-X9-DG protein